MNPSRPKALRSKSDMERDTILHSVLSIKPLPSLDYHLCFMWLSAPKELRKEAGSWRVKQALAGHFL